METTFKFEFSFIMIYIATNFLLKERYHSQRLKKEACG